MNYANKFKSFYESLPVKVKLFLNMLVAANTAALAIYLCLLSTPYELTYELSLRYFLACRVVLFMANKQMPLTDENVAFMSSERSLWNTATIAVFLAMIALIFCIRLIF